MSDSPPERNSNSKSNLIEVQHVGVTAKLQSPLKSLMLSYSSSTESENNQILYRGSHHSNAKYNKFLNEISNGTDTTLTDHSTILYEMKAGSMPGKRKCGKKLTPSKIEFQLYTKPKKRLQKSNQTKKPKRQLFKEELQNEAKSLDKKDISILQRLKQSFKKIKSSKRQQQPIVDKIFEDLPEPEVLKQNLETAPHIQIGIYPFEHGSVDYLKTHDCPPQILALVLAERATHCATRFWAEFFGSLQIGVAFIVTFFLQSYRFVLYSMINIFVVEFLHMTSDYLLKPLLTVIFNGFLQPPLIFCFNVLSMVRDILEPIAESLNNFMKPVATVGRSIRLIHVSYNKKNIAKNV